VSTFNELIDFTRSTTGTYLDSVVYGEELVVNNAFNDTTAWYEPRNSSTISAVSNKLRSTADSAATFGGATTLAGLTVGKKYKIQGTASSNNSSAIVRIRVGIPQDLGSAYIEITQLTGSVTASTYFIATAETMHVGTIVTGHNGGDYVEFDAGFSVKEITGGQVSGTPLLRTAAINEPRLEYDAQGNALGLLIEEARTNLLEYSNQANQLSYSADGATTGVDTTEVTSLAGSGTVIKLNKTSGGKGFARVSYGSTTNAQTLSAFVKKGTARYIGFRQLAVASTHTTFDLETNTWVQTAGSTSRGYEDYGNGWLRLWVVSDDSDSKVWASLCIANSGGAENNSETGTVYVYGIQRETGLFPTSYIPTSGSAVTRVVDSAVATLSDFYYRQKNGSMVVEFTSKYDESAGLVKRVCEIGNTVTSDNRIMTYVKTDETRLSSQVWDNDDNEFSKTLTTSVPNGTGVYSKVALAWETNNAHAAFDGDLVGSADTDVSLTQTRDTLGIMRSTTGTTNSLTGHIKSIQYYPLRVADAKLETLTS